MLSRSETIYSTVHYGMSAVSIGVEGINKTLQVVKTGSKVALKSTRHVVGQAHKMLSDMRMPYSEHYKEKEKRQMRLVHDRCKATIGHIPELLLMDEKFTKPKAQVQANDLNSTTWEGKLNSVSSSSILRDNCCAIINHTCKYQFHRQERREGCGYPNDPTNLVLIELRHWICDRLAREHKYTREFLEETKARLCYVQHLLGKGIFPSGRTSQITMRHTLFMVGMQLEECIKKIRRRLDSSTTHELICNLTKSLKSVVTPTIRYLWISWRNTKEEEATIPCTIPEFRAWCRAREAMGTSDSACLLLRDVLLSPGIFALYPDLGGEPRTTTSFLISNNSSKLQEGRHSTTREEKSSQEDKDWIDVEEFTVPRPGSLDDGREYFKLPRLARGVLSHFLSKRGALDAYAELHEKLKVLGELILALKSAESPSAQGGQILLVHAVGGVLNELLREIEGALNEMSQLMSTVKRISDGKFAQWTATCGEAEETWRDNYTDAIAIKQEVDKTIEKVREPLYTLAGHLQHGLREQKANLHRGLEGFVKIAQAACKKSRKHRRTPIAPVAPPPLPPLHPLRLQLESEPSIRYSTGTTVVLSSID